MYLWREVVMSLKLKKCCTGYFVPLSLPRACSKKEAGLWRCSLKDQLLCLIQRMGHKLNLKSSCIFIVIYFCKKMVVSSHSYIHITFEHIGGFNEIPYECHIIGSQLSAIYFNSFQQPSDCANS
jgi:hypothetical protein